jgi:hypothetical protein
LLAFNLQLWFSGLNSVKCSILSNHSANTAVAFFEQKMANETFAKILSNFQQLICFILESLSVPILQQTLSIFGRLNSSVTKVRRKSLKIDKAEC